MTIFKKIIDREIPADLVYEDERCLAFKDVNPQAPVHILVIPKKEISNLMAATSEDQDLLGYLMLKAKEIAVEMGIAETGFRLVLNCNRHGGQTVDHLHLHLLGGRSMSWPPG